MRETRSLVLSVFVIWSILHGAQSVLAENTTSFSDPTTAPNQVFTEEVKFDTNETETRLSAVTTKGTAIPHERNFSQVQNTCSSSRLGTSSCSFQKGLFCGGVDNGYGCDHQWFVTKGKTRQSTENTEDGYAYLEVTDTAGTPCKLESTVYGQSVKAVCIEFQYTSIGDNEHGFHVGFEHGRHQTELFSVPPRNTAGKWYKIGASCCLQGADSESERYINIDITNVTVDNTVAIDYLDVRVANRTCGIDEPLCTVFEAGIPINTEPSQHPTENITRFDGSATPTNPVYTQEVKLDTNGTGTTSITVSGKGSITPPLLNLTESTTLLIDATSAPNPVYTQQVKLDGNETVTRTSDITSTPFQRIFSEGRNECSSSRLGTSSCSFQKGLFCGGVNNGYACQHLWSVSKEDGYAYLEVTDTAGAPCKLESTVYGQSVKAVCIEFHYTSIGDSEHGVDVGFEHGGYQTDLFSVAPRNTAGKWYKIGASCCLQGANSESERYINIGITNATVDSTVAIGKLDVRVANRTCDIDEPVCSVYEAGKPINNEYLFHPTVTSSNLDNLENITRFDGSATPTNPVSTQEVKLDTNGTGTTSITVSGKGSTTPPLLNLTGRNECSSSRLGTSSCSFQKGLFCGGINNGYACQHLWSVSKEDSYAYLEVTDTAGAPCKLESTVYGQSVKAVCIEFQYTSIGDKEHGIHVGFEHGGFQTGLFSVAPRNTAGKWYKIGASCCLQRADSESERYINIGITNATVDSTVAIGKLDVRVANRTCDIDEPVCSVYEAGKPINNEYLFHPTVTSSNLDNLENITRFDGSATPTNPVSTQEVKLDTNGTGTTSITVSGKGSTTPPLLNLTGRNECSSSRLGTSSCSFQKGLFCGGINNGYACQHLWSVSKEDSYAYLEVTDTAGAPCKLESTVYGQSVKAVCIEFQYTSIGDKEHGIHVGFEHGGFQTGLFSVAPRNTAGKWYKIGASCCLQRADSESERYINIGITNATVDSTVAIGKLDVRVANRTCDIDEPVCSVYEAGIPINNEYLFHPTVTSSNLDNLENITRFDGSATPTNPVSTQEVKLDTNGTGTTSITVSGKGSTTPPLLNLTENTTLLIDATTAPNPVYTQEVKLDANETVTRTSDITSTPFQRIFSKGRNECSSSRLGTSSCSFQKGLFCGGINNGYACQHLWSVSKEDSYAYLEVTDTAGAPCKLESTVYGQSVKAVCIEFQYTSIGDKEHGIHVGFEHGGFQTGLFSVAPRNTAGKWYKIGASCCLQRADSESERYINIGITNATVDSTVAIGKLDMRVANRTCDIDEPVCSVYEAGIPINNEYLFHPTVTSSNLDNLENITRFDGSATPTNPVSTQEVKLDTNGTGTTSITVSGKVSTTPPLLNLTGRNECSSSRLGTSSCSFQKGLFCGGINNGYACQHLWSVSKEDSYAYLEVTDTAGAPCKLESTVYGQSVKAVCIEFQYTSIGDKEHGIHVGFEHGGFQTGLFSVAPRNTAGKWYKIGASCCLQRADSESERYINIGITNATVDSTVAIGKLDVRVANRTCDIDEPVCSVYEAGIPINNEYLFHPTVTSSNLDNLENITRFDGSATPTNPVSTQEVKLDTNGTGTTSITVSGKGSTTPPLLNLTENTTLLIDATTAPNPVYTQEVKLDANETVTRTSDITSTPFQRIFSKGRNECSSSRLGTSSCSFQKGLFCGGINNGYACQHLWSVSKDGYAYLEVTDTTGTPCKLESLVYLQSVKAVCIEFHYTSMGDNEHGIHVGFEQGGHQTELFSVPPRNTAEKWYKIGASCCLQGADTDFYRYINIDITNATVDNTVAIDNLDVRVANRTCGIDEPLCTVFEAGEPIKTEPLPHPTVTSSTLDNVENITRFDDSATPTNPVYTQEVKFNPNGTENTTSFSDPTTAPNQVFTEEVKFDTNETETRLSAVTTKGTAIPFERNFSQAQNTCSSSRLGTSSCSFQKGLFCGGVDNGYGCDHQWFVTKDGYAYLEVTDTTGTPCKLESLVYLQSVKAVCIEFHYTSMGDNEHGIHVGFEQGGHQTELFSVPPRNTAEKWYKIGASCCLQGADTDFYRYINIDITNATVDNTVAIDNLDVRVANRTCGIYEPLCTVFEAGEPIKTEPLPHPTVTSSTLDNVENITRFDDSATPTNPVYTQEVKFNPNGTENTTSFSDPTTAPNQVFTEEVKFDTNETETRLSAVTTKGTAIPFERNFSQAQNTCSSSRLGTSSCSFQKGLFCGGVDNGYGCDHQWFVTKDGYAYLEVTDTTGTPCKLESLVYLQSVKAVCIEFHYTSMGDNEHGIHVGFEQGGHQTELFSVPPRNTAEKWYKIGASCCLQGADTDFYRYINIDITNATVDNTVAIDNLDVRVANRTCGIYEPLCTVFEAGEPIKTEPLPHPTVTSSTLDNVENITRFDDSATPTNPVYTQEVKFNPNGTENTTSFSDPTTAPNQVFTEEVKFDTNETETRLSAVTTKGTAIPFERNFSQAQNTCSSSRLGTSSCSFQKGLFCGGVDNGYGCDHQWFVTKEDGYAYLKITDTAGAPCKLESTVYGQSVKAVCIEFHYTSIGDNEHGVDVGFEHGGYQTDLFSVAPRNTAGKWYKIGASCCLQGANSESERYINIGITNATVDSTVAIGKLDVRVANRTCDIDEPVCSVYEAGIPIKDEPLFHPTEDITRFDGSATPTNPVYTQEVKFDTDGTGTKSPTVTASRSITHPSLNPTGENCSNSRLGTSSCSFHKGLFCGGVNNGYDCEHQWIGTKGKTGQITVGFSHEENTDDGYAYLEVTGTAGPPCKLESNVFYPSVRAVCIEFHYASTGDGEHGINVGFEHRGQQTHLFSMPPRNTAGLWYKVGASCCLQADDSDRYRFINIEITNASKSSTVALDQLDVRVSSKACPADGPLCSVYELTRPTVQQYPDIRSASGNQSLTKDYPPGRSASHRSSLLSNQDTGLAVAGFALAIMLVVVVAGTISKMVRPKVEAEDHFNLHDFDMIVKPK
ncbi:hypothetical protein RRG08_045869 [Elysia crispata]|uniref:MAM domain-containing protein n=1 Tax=Elysia crispata TaxID=231223 RepID=A0AAE0ZFM3_9GAST|nr:hypothetical protein RRG08_045869 [Elysia crispata]